MRLALAVAAVFGLLGACGGGGDDVSGFVPLDHNPLPEVPAGPDLSDDDDANGGRRPTVPEITLLDLETFERAIAVIGQHDFQGQDPNQGTGTAADTLRLPNRLVQPSGMAEGERLWVADPYNHRVLGYALPLSGNGPNAEIALGQASLTSTYSGTSDGDYIHPTDVAVTKDKLFICDSGNSRILIFDGLPTATGASADIVVGQMHMFDNAPATTVKGLSWPQSVCVTGNKLLVADTGNNRVMIWNYIPGGDHASASLVLGQGDFTSNQPATTATGMRTPMGVWSDGTKVLVADTYNNRVLVWNTFPTQNGQAADRVLGAPHFDGRIDYTSTAAGWPSNHYHVSTILAPVDVESNGQQVLVSDLGASRVLIWSTWPSFNHEQPRLVLGQRKFDFGWPNDDDQNRITDATPSDRTFYGSNGLHIAGKRLYVADGTNHRVLVFE
ncbi:MAG: hypothetical protein QNJ98_17620 [Planctomycetota bacterium]|nr:hypothetical protein [Planctomycetota bacterium]